MARKRMFSLDIIDTDMFTEMPQTTRLLYYELCMRADDDGFVDSPKKIQRMVGCSDDDMKILIAKQFIIAFESGIIVIRHWRIHNIIQKDRYKETLYVSEKQLLKQDTALVYNLDTECIQDVSEVETQIRLDKNRLELDKNRKDKDIPPPPKEPSLKKDKPQKIHFADYVCMTNAEYEKLVSTHSKDFADQCITILDNYKGSKGKTYKDDYRAILSWVVDEAQKRNKTSPTSNPMSQRGTFDALEYLQGGN